MISLFTLKKIVWDFQQWWSLTKYINSCEVIEICR